jgi:hypothetical protein
MSTEKPNLIDDLGGPSDVWNEFAEIRVSVDYAGLTPRLFLENMETGESTHLDPLELAAFIATPDDQRVNWLRVGAYTGG